MKECDIFRGQNILCPLIDIIRGSGPPTLPYLRPSVQDWNDGRHSTTGETTGPGEHRSEHDGFPPPRAGSGVVRIDPLRFLAGCPIQGD